jgi:hypothetical protein
MTGLNFQTSLAALKDAIASVFEQGRFDAIRPEHWAATHRREPEEIIALMDGVRADRATRISPNAAIDALGEGK